MLHNFTGKSTNPDNMHLFKRAVMRAIGLPHLEAGEHIFKLHDDVVKRDAAVAEQFMHADVVIGSFAGIALVGVDSGEQDQVPETQMVNNADLYEWVFDSTRNTPLEDRLEDIQVVRPKYDPNDLTEWKDLPRHVFERFKQLDLLHMLSDDQKEHILRDTEGMDTKGNYTGPVHLSPLVQYSIIDWSPMITCGAASREIRLGFKGKGTPDEQQELDDLHNRITRHLLSSDATYKSVKVEADRSYLFLQDNCTEPLRTTIHVIDLSSR